DPDRAGLHRGHRHLLCRCRQGRSQDARRRVREGDGGARAEVSERPRGRDLLRAVPQRHAESERQDVRQPAQSGGDPREGVRRPARAPGRGALPDPLLRLPADRAERPARRAAVRVDRALGAACAAHALAAIPARYELERRAWTEASDLSLHPQSLSWSKFPQAESINAFARGLGAARSCNVAGAKKEVTRLESLASALTTAKNAYW